jgi:large subunit ribosomal protein L6
MVKFKVGDWRLSRIGKKPVEIPKGVTISLEGRLIKVKGPKGELHRTIHPAIKAEISIWKNS